MKDHDHDHDHDEPRDPLWDLLGKPPAPTLPDGFDERFAQRLRRSSAQDALGEDLWDVLGAAPAPPPPGPPDVSAVRVAAVRSAARPRWRLPVVGLAVAAAVLVVVVASLRGSPAEDAAMVEELDFALHLDLVMDPDFELLVKWDGEPP